MNYVSELVVKRDWAGVAGVLRKIRSYQQKEGEAHMLPGCVSVPKNFITGSIGRCRSPRHSF